MRHEGGVLGPADRLGKMELETYYPCYLLYAFRLSRSKDDRAIQSSKNQQMNVHKPRGQAAAPRDYETCYFNRLLEHIALVQGVLFTSRARRLARRFVFDVVMRSRCVANLHRYLVDNYA